MSILDLSLPNVDATLFSAPPIDRLAPAVASTHAPRFLMLFGSVRERFHSKLLTLEAACLLIAMGGEVRVFDPTGSPLPDRSDTRGDGLRGSGESLNLARRGYFPERLKRDARSTR